MSTIIDPSGRLHFDARGRSRIEELLENHDFAADPALLERARHCLDRIRRRGISKYNLSESYEVESSHPWFQRRNRKRVLVIGQVESDASIAYGAPDGSDNGRLVWEARKRNPDADIFFRPHPDTYLDPRKIATPIDDLAGMAHILPKGVAFRSSLVSVDEIYTITSLAGFEALFYGKKVHTLGAPFYAGWGLTEDLSRSSSAWGNRSENPFERRTRKLSLEEVFAAAYILYPRYHNPFSGEAMTLEQVLDMIDLGKRLRTEVASSSSPYEYSHLPNAMCQMPGGDSPLAESTDHDEP